MTEKFFLLKVQMPDWADKPEQMERVREEIEEHAGACVAFFTRATQVQVKCELAEPVEPSQSLRWMGPKV